MQFFLYLIVGGLSFVVDIGVFVGLREATIPVITASVISFIAATVANYQLSLLLAFERGRFRRHIELMHSRGRAGRPWTKHGAGVVLRLSVRDASDRRQDRCGPNRTGMELSRAADAGVQRPHTGPSASLAEARCHVLLSSPTAEQDQGASGPPANGQAACSRSISA